MFTWCFNGRESVANMGTSENYSKPMEFKKHTAIRVEIMFFFFFKPDFFFFFLQHTFWRHKVWIWQPCCRECYHFVTVTAAFGGNVFLMRVFVLQRASCWSRIWPVIDFVPELGKHTQWWCGACRPEPKGHTKVWHLLGRLGIHKLNPECILKPAAADGCYMTERRSGGWVSPAAHYALFS